MAEPEEVAGNFAPNFAPRPLLEMRDLVAAKDWSQTPLGPMEAWSTSLRMALDIVLSSGFPMALRWGPEFVLIYNDGYRPILGDKHPWALGLPASVAWSEVWPQIEPFHRQIMSRESEAVFTEDTLLRIQRHQDRWDDAHFILGYSPTPDPTAPGGIGGIFVTAMEITERIEAERQVLETQKALRTANEELAAAEAALRKLNETLEAAVDERTRERDRLWRNSQDLIAVVGPDGVFQAANPAWKRILGWEETEVVGRHHLELNHLEDRVTSEAALLQASNEELPPYESRLAHKDGGYRWISWVAASEGDLVYASGRHITAEKEAANELALAQEALRQSQKMEAIGQLTGGVAHDFNNMLAIVIGNLDIALRRLERGGAEVERYLAHARDGASRAAILTQRLLAFSRQSPLSPATVELNGLVAGMSELLRRTLGERIELETVLAGGLWPAQIDPSQLESAIVNLAVNARDAMTDGGRLTIETNNAYLDDRYVAREVGVAAGQYVMIAVSDVGSGISPDVLAKVFDPFFTTKPVGKGTGLGLSMIYGFVKQSGGHVKIYSEPGQGTTVKLYLPRSSASAADGPEPSAQDAPKAAFRDETVLVVEDDDSVRQMTVDALGELGYRVHAASGGEQAIRAFETLERIDILFTDVVMPGMSGRQLADELLARNPRLKVLYTTGYTRNAIVHNGVLDLGVTVLPKPFSVEELATKIRAVLDAEPG